jgi:hypothetical protein
MSLKVKIEGLQFFSKHQKQRSKEENMKRRKRIFVIFCLNVFEENPISFSFLVHFK